MRDGSSGVPRSAVPEIAADLILYNGTVLTMDALNRRAEAVAVRQERVQATGSTSDLLKLAGPETRLIDLERRTAVPGFIETHSHPMTVGEKLRRRVDVGTPPNETIEDILARVREQASTTPKGQWILGDGYDDTLLREKRHPTRWDLDRVAQEHPVFLTHISGHLSVANTLALRLGGVTRMTLAPPGSAIFHDDNGEPTGVLAEPDAQQLVARQIPPPTVDDIVKNLGVASREYLRAGVTSAHDLGVGWRIGAAEITAYRTAIRQGVFRQRCYAFMAEDLLFDAEGRVGPLEAAIHGLGDEWFRLGAAKLFADGSIQGLTGALSQPYHNAPHTRGLELNTRDQLTQKIQALRDAGWQVGIHGNGDAAIQNIIDAYAAAGVGQADGDHRCRIEHCQMVRDDQLERMREMGIYASIFVKHVYYWGDRHRDIFIGPQRASRISPLRSAQQRAVRFALHSDCPVTPVSPLEGIWVAVNRITRQRSVLGSDQRVDVVSALRAYTSDAAYFSFEEHLKGTLEPGKFADLAVLSADPTQTPDERLNTLRVEATIIAGNVAWTEADTRGPSA